MAVWHFEDRNPYSCAVTRIIERYLKSAPPAVDAPEPFRFARPGKLRDILLQAGAASASERLLQFRMQTPVSVEDFWTLRYEISETVREKLARLSTNQLSEVKSQVLDAYREYTTAQGMSFPAEVLIVSGSKYGPA